MTDLLIVMSFQTLHEKLIEELNRQIYIRSVQTPSMQRGGSTRLSRRDASVWGWTDGLEMDKPVTTHSGTCFDFLLFFCVLHIAVL